MDNLNFTLKAGNALFVLGANGVGKSALMHRFFKEKPEKTKRILAHRQTWFMSDVPNMTATQKNQNEENIRSYDITPFSRSKDSHSHTRPDISIYNLIKSQNTRALDITAAIDDGDETLAKNLAIQQPSNINAINEILAISNISITITLKDEQLFALKNESEPYSYY